jgi:hypothetical protein
MEPRVFIPIDNDGCYLSVEQDTLYGEHMYAFFVYDICLYMSEDLADAH